MNITMDRRPASPSQFVQRRLQGPVVCVVDGFDRSLPALREAVRIAAEDGVGLTVVYAETSAHCLVSPEGGVWVVDVEELERSVAERIQRETRAVPWTQIEIVRDCAAHAASRIARECRAALVLAPASGSTLSRILHGDVARRLRKQTPCPVLAVRA